MRQYKTVQSGFWRANTLDEGAKKLEKNSAWRQLVDDATEARNTHTKMGDSLEAHDWLHGSLARSEARSTPVSPAACRSSPPSARRLRSSVFSVRLSVSTAR